MHYQDYACTMLNWMYFLPRILNAFNQKAAKTTTTKNIYIMRQFVQLNNCSMGCVNDASTNIEIFQLNNAILLKSILRVIKERLPRHFKIIKDNSWHCSHIALIIGTINSHLVCITSLLKMISFLLFSWKSYNLDIFSHHYKDIVTRWLWGGGEGEGRGRGRTRTDHTINRKREREGGRGGLSPWSCSDGNRHHDDR